MIECTYDEAVNRLIWLVEKIVVEAGNSACFNAGSWVNIWLAQSNPALGGRMPEELMHTPEGRGAVAGLLSAAAHGYTDERGLEL